MMQLEDLPEPVLFKILEYTNLQSKFNLMLANKFFYEIIGKNSRFCEFITSSFSLLLNPLLIHKMYGKPDLRSDLRVVTVFVLLKIVQLPISNFRQGLPSQL